MKVKSIFIAFAMFFVLFSQSAFAANNDFNIKDGVLLKYNGSDTVVTIPDGVTSIGDNAFEDCYKITNITLPDTVISIGEYSFSRCDNLTSINIPDSVTSIGNGAFYWCKSLKYIELPDNLTSIGDGAFFNCKALQEINIPSGITEISDSLFMGCSGLDNVYIPNSVTYIDEYAFFGCNDLSNIVIPPNVYSIGDSAIELYDDDFTISGKIDSYAETYAQKNNIPFKVITSGVSIDGSDFVIRNGVLIEYTGSEKNITIPDGVTSIGDRAFFTCDITSVTIPDSVTEIGMEAFYKCKNLKNINFSNNLTTIGDLCFAYCDSLTNITIPKSVTLIRRWAFQECKNLNNLVIPSNVISMLEGAFRYCDNLTNVTINEGVKIINRWAFSGCKNLSTVILPSSLTKIGNGVFEDSPKVVIYGYNNSIAADYAKNNNIPFKLYEGNINTAYASTQTVYVDNEKVEFQMYALKDASGNPTNYIKLRDLAYVLNDTAAKFNVTWNGQINIKTNASYEQNGSEMKTPYSGNQKYSLSEAVTNINNIPAPLEAIVINDNNGGSYTYYKLRDLGKSIGFYVGWSSEKGIYLETNKKYQ